MQSRDLINYAIHFDGDWDRIALAIRHNIRLPLRSSRDKAITILDAAYPSCLKQLRYPPWVLFYEGDITLLKTPMVTIVGSRQMSSYGEMAGREVARVLKERYTLVSGLARGIDGLVHRTALNEGHTIGVIGSGLGTHYPKENDDLYRMMKKDHLILSEYPRHTGVRREHFPWRNRILAALGKVLIVVEAKTRSGTSLTVNEALALSKDVYAVPHPLSLDQDEGTNRLIYDGAFIIYGRGQLEEI